MKHTPQNSNIMESSIESIVSQDTEYVSLVSHITRLWQDAKEQAYTAVNTSLLMASWNIGHYIVEFEQQGSNRAKYGERLLVNLSKDLTRINGRGFSRSNLTYMRKFYLAFPKCETISHKLTWSHYFELLKCDNPIEMQFYMNEAIKEGWRVKQLQRQINSSL